MQERQQEAQVDREAHKLRSPQCEELSHAGNLLWPFADAIGTRRSSQLIGLRSSQGSG